MAELSEEQHKKLKIIFAQLRAIDDTLHQKETEMVSNQIVNSYFRLLKDLESVSEKDFSQFKIKPDAEYTTGRKLVRRYFNLSFKSILRQLIALINIEFESVESKPIVGIGNIIKIIKDNELKERCIDLLSAQENFDRVIREATTILEHRIRNLADPDLTEVGVKLVNTVLHNTRGLLVIDGTPSEQEGFYQLYRGTMLSFRGETHHKLSDQFSREDAMKILAFIDILLDILNETKVRESK